MVPPGEVTCTRKTDGGSGDPCASAAAPATAPAPIAAEHYTQTEARTDAEAGVGTPLANLTLPTITTYEQACARCHGPQGMFHWKQVTALDAGALPAKIQQMMTQQGMLRPTPADEQAMLAYHKAMHDVGPGGPLFIVATNAEAYAAGREPALKGEATAGAALTLVDATGAEQAVPLDGTEWNVSATPPFELRAALDGTTVRMRFPEAAWAH